MALFSCYRYMCTLTIPPLPSLAVSPVPWPSLPLPSPYPHVSPSCQSQDVKLIYTNVHLTGSPFRPNYRLTIQQTSLKKHQSKATEKDITHFNLRR